MRITFSFLFFCLFGLLAAQPKVASLNDLENLIKSKSDQIQVINFWATWCGPCVKELPLFEKVNHERNDVSVTLVSLDFEIDDNPEKVFKFVERKQIKSTVLILDAPDINSWIDRIEKRWAGSLPATLVINTKTGKRAFAGKELKPGELDLLIDSVKN